MKLLNLVKKFITTGEKPTEVPNGVCPNCWGHQEYNDEFYAAIKKENIDTNNVDQKQGWIQAYATKHFEGIMLHEHEEDDAHMCEKCKFIYKKEEK